MLRRPSARTSVTKPPGDGLPSYGRRRPFGTGSTQVDYEYDSESEGNDGDYFYGGYGSPASSQEFKDKALPPRGNRLRLAIWKCRMMSLSVPIAALTLLFMLSTFRYHTQQRHLLSTLPAKSLDHVVTIVSKLKDDNRKWEREIFTQKGNERETHARYTALERSNRLLQKQVDELRVVYESPEKRNEELRVAAREDAWKDQVQLLQQATVREAKRAATEKFGPGPHYVQFNIRLPADPPTVDRSFILEMAPLASMPHSVHLFLEQVAHNLWNNSYFYLNGPHVMQGGPQAEQSQVEDTGLDERTLAIRPFVELQLDHLAFPEYSDDFPHVPWTVGFTGRPGGPDFYINKVDNTIAHGPGGQYQHDLEEFADPCFAKVVDGYDTLHEMFREETYLAETGYGYFLQDPIQIVRAIVTTSPTRVAMVIETDAAASVEATPETTTAAAAVESVAAEPQVVTDPGNESQEQQSGDLAMPHIEHQVEP